MKMGLGFWKFTTLVLLFVLVFLDKAEGGKGNKSKLEPRQKGSPDDEFEVTSIFFDCASYWTGKLDDPCMKYKNGGFTDFRGVLNLSLAESYRQTKEMFEKLCDHDKAFRCSSFPPYVCGCTDTKTCWQSRTRDQNKNCVKEFRAYWEFEKKKLDNSRSSGFGSRPRFENMLWTSLFFIIVLNLY